MKRVVALVAVAMMGVLAITSLASGNPAQTAAKVTKFNAALNTGQVVPHLKNANVRAAGHFSATFTITTLKWTLTFSHLSGRATSAHIHFGVRGKTGFAFIALCGPCKSPMSGTFTSVTYAQAQLMKHSGTYVDIQTAKHPAGEIRGQITLAR